MTIKRCYNINLIVYFKIYYTSKYTHTRPSTHLPKFIVTLSHVTKLQKLRTRFLPLFFCCHTVTRHKNAEGG